VQEMSQKQSIPLLWCKRLQAELLPQEAYYGTLATVSKKPLEKLRATPGTPYRLRAMFNFPVQQ